jgi:hypothetical protein
VLKMPLAILAIALSDGGGDSAKELYALVVG